MKKTIAISLIIAFCLTGCSLGNKKTEDTAKQVEDTSLLGQLNSGQAMACAVTTLNGEVIIKVKDNKIRMEGIPYIYDQATSSEGVAVQNNSGIMISIGDEQYIWSGQKGTKLNLKELSELTGGQTEEQMAAKDWQSTVGEWQQAGFNYKCEKQSLSDDIFTPPSDVSFTDLNEALRLLQNLNQQTFDNASINSTSSDIVSDPAANISTPTAEDNTISE